jgi:excisionase family DNA binding protein
MVVGTTLAQGPAMDKRSHPTGHQQGSDECTPEANLAPAGREDGNAFSRRQNRSPGGFDGWQPFLTVSEVATALRTSRKAVYTMAARAQLPGVTRIGRRLLVRRDDLLAWLDERRAATSGGTRR